MILTLDGPPGSGKSTVARLLAARLGLPLESVGKIFRGLAKERGVSLAEFGKMAEVDESIDIELDNRTVALAKSSKGMVIEGRLTGPILKRAGVKSFRVYIDAPLDVRAHRVAGRDMQSENEAREAIATREASEGARYKKIYGIKQGDIANYHLVVDTSKMTPEEICNIISESAQKWSRENG